MQKTPQSAFVAMVSLGLALAAGCCGQQGSRIDAGKAQASQARSAPVAGSGPATRAGASTRPLLPEAAEKAVRSLYAKARFHKIEPARTLGVDVYTVHLARLATKVAVTADGQILLVGHQVAPAELPKGVAAAVAKNCGASQVRVTRVDVRAEVRKDGERAGVVKVEPLRTHYEVQVLRASDPKFHKVYLRVDGEGSPLK